MDERLFDLQATAVTNKITPADPRSRSFWMVAQQSWAAEFGRYATTMRTGVILILLAGLVGCSRSPELPEGVSVRVLSGNVIVTLDENVAIQVRQNKQDSRIALVGNHDGTLHVLQLEQSGDPTPRSMTLITRDKAEFSTMTGSGTSRVVILDQDGDGLPDLKIEGGKKFRRANIEWKEIIK